MRHAIIVILVTVTLIAIAVALVVHHVDTRRIEVERGEANTRAQHSADSYNNNEMAKQAYNEGDYDTAFRLWRSIADHVDEWDLHTPAAINAFDRLGRMYYSGYGVPQNYAEAMHWFRKAADYDLPDAQFCLGVIYEHGQGVESDDAEAATWYRKAADYGVGDAQYNLGLMYDQGRGVPVDYVLAYKWENLAAASNKLSTIAAMTRDEVEAKMKPGQLAEAQRLAREWTPRKWRCCIRQ